MNCIELYRIVDWKVYRLTFQSLDLDEIGSRSVHSRQKETMVLIPKKTRRQILEHLFKEGVMVVKKDYQAGFHRDFITISSYFSVGLLSSRSCRWVMRAEGSEGVWTIPNVVRATGLQAQWAGGHPKLARDDGLEVPCFPPLLARNLQLALALLHPDQRGHRIPPWSASPSRAGLPTDPDQAASYPTCLGWWWVRGRRWQGQGQGQGSLEPGPRKSWYWIAWSNCRPNGTMKYTEPCIFRAKNFDRHQKKGYTKTGLEIKSIVLRIAKTILIIRSSNVQSFDS